MGKLEKFGRWTKERGLVWTLLYAGRSLLLKLTHRLEASLIAIEKRRFLTGERTISSVYHSAAENRKIWNTYDWSEGGEEWTRAAHEYKGLDPERWKAALIDGMMRPHIRSGSTVLEIGPGAGRWTETLQTIAGRLLIADISEKCLAVCKNRFRERTNIEYCLIGDEGLRFAGDGRIDAIWSYDVFVHINPTIIDSYLGDVARILRPGGVAVIHHSGTYRTESEASLSYRSHIDGRFFARLVEKHGLRMKEQNTSLPHKPGDVISVFERPTGT